MATMMTSTSTPEPVLKERKKPSPAEEDRRVSRLPPPLGGEPPEPGDVLATSPGSAAERVGDWLMTPQSGERVDRGLHLGLHRLGQRGVALRGQLLLALVGGGVGQERLEQVQLVAGVALGAGDL